MQEYRTPFPRKGSAVARTPLVFSSMEHFRCTLWANITLASAMRDIELQEPVYLCFGDTTAVSVSAVPLQGDTDSKEIFARGDEQLQVAISL